jgi:hypothetical protein
MCAQKSPPPSSFNGKGNVVKAAMGDGFAIIMPCKQIEEGAVQPYYCWTFRLSMMLKKKNRKKNESPFLATDSKRQNR